MCGVTSTTLAANTPVVGTGAWSMVSGAGGSFGNGSSPTSSFSGVAGTSYTLRWTISNPPCTASTDDVVITFQQNPIANPLGTDASCFGGTGSITATATGGNGSYQFSLDGAAFQVSGSFANVAVGPHNVVARDGNNCLSPAAPVSIGAPAAVAANPLGTD